MISDNRGEVLIKIFFGLKIDAERFGTPIYGLLGDATLLGFPSIAKQTLILTRSCK